MEGKGMKTTEEIITTCLQTHRSFPEGTSPADLMSGRETKTLLNLVLHTYIKTSFGIGCSRINFQTVPLFYEVRKKMVCVETSLGAQFSLQLLEYRPSPKISSY